jgi:hypothetical protein
MMIGRLDQRNSTHLALLRSPLSVRVSVIDNLIASGIPDLERGVRECSLGRPAKLVAGRLGDQERLGAALVSIVVDAVLDGIVEDRALGDLGSCRFQRWYHDTRVANVRLKRVPVRARPAVTTDWKLGMYMMGVVLWYVVDWCGGEYDVVLPAFLYPTEEVT